MSHHDPSVSVILNVHREARFIARTVKSLGEAASFSAHAGTRSELVVVFDRSDEQTKTVTRSLDFTGFVHVEWVETDYGSLGAARNAGLDRAGGEYVWLADADDLVSYNCLHSQLLLARSHENCVVFPEYLVAFGDACWVARYFGDDRVETADFLFGHPFISRVFTKRAAFNDLRFRDLRLSQGFAYEDWHMNCELRARGFAFLVAPRTVFFYRQRQGSLLREANAISVRQIPHSSLFETKRLSDLVSRERKQRDQERFLARRAEARNSSPRSDLLDDVACMELTAAASAVDPGINLHEIRHGGNWTNVFPDVHVGHAYAEAAMLVGDARFTDVVLLPGLSAGGGERFILDVLRVLEQSTPGFRALVIAGEPAESHDWRHRLSSGCTFLDVYGLFPALGDEGRDALVLRLALALAPDARLHIKQSAFGFRFFRKFANSLEGMDAVFYRFSDAREVRDGTPFELGWGFDFISTCLPLLRHVICDHMRIAHLDRLRLGLEGGKWSCVYAAHDARARDWNQAPTGRLLWASRISTEKRPGLLARIAERLAGVLPGVSIDVFGAASPEIDVESIFHGWSNLKYRGAYEEFAFLQPPTYDGFLYTTQFDGLPNAILEAMSWGLPVVAPAVGGIPEAVIDRVTGYLVPDLQDEEELLDAYLHGVQWLYTADAAGRERLGRAAQAIVRERHSHEAHRRSVERVFGAGDAS